MGVLASITLAEFRRGLQNLGFKHIRTKGSHETWAHAGLKRSFTLPNNTDPVLPAYVLSICRTAQITKAQFLAACGRG
ncbi:MAG: type II toxin-antitoxin system HicA family toxin [Bacteroidia bacterium]|nr:type II toxin-antitoxin system HicA family toxin [Bacteroidia bacterium]